ncbi:hypothetical protein Pd630_LPD10048 (plasmid) [Rhodococcus opacus PD630]|nr:hypothetical protein Pd630_LPD10048 [Rhodococcus opacus PD630]
MAQAQSAGDQAASDRLTQSIDKLEGRRDRLLGEFRHQQREVDRLETELREAGIDPESLSHRAVLKTGRQVELTEHQAQLWRTEPATERQLDTLAAMLDRRGMPRELLEAPLTKGEADQAIKAALDGKQPALTWPRGEITTPFVVAEQAPGPVPVAALPGDGYEQESVPEPEPVADPRQTVIAAVVTRAAADEGLNLAASAESNTHDQYFGWAVREAKSQAFSALADLMDEGDQPTRVAARTLLADEALWSEIPREVAERVWQTHRGEPNRIDAAAQDLAEKIAEETNSSLDPRADQTQAALETADTLDTSSELGRQSVAQAAIDVAATPEIANWTAVGRAAFNPNQVLDDPDPTADPLVAAALADVRANSKVANLVRADFVTGYNTARHQFLEPEMTRIDAEIAVDTEIVELVKRLGTGPNQLAFTTEFTQLFRRKLESLPEETDLRVAAIREMRTCPPPCPISPQTPISPTWSEPTSSPATTRHDTSSSNPK